MEFKLDKTQFSELRRALRKVPVIKAKRKREVFRADRLFAWTEAVDNSR